MSKALFDSLKSAAFISVVIGLILRCPASAESGVKPQATVNQSGPVILELFTSEGCSSCPAADDIMSELARQYPDRVATLSRHVDYWNNLGWTDPNSAPVFTNRQRSYSNKLGLNQVYTPQLIVDGVAQTVGNSPRKVNELLNDALKHPPLKLVIKPTVNKTKSEIEVSCAIDPEWNQNDSLQIAITENNLASKVTSGENSGRTLKHDGVVRAFASSKIPASTGKHDDGRVYSFKTRPEWNLSQVTIIAFLQEQGSSKVLASAKSKLE